MSIQNDINLALQNKFQLIHEDSYHVYYPREGPIGLTVRFDTRFSTSSRNDQQNMSIDVSIFNTKSPTEIFDIISKIEEYFEDVVLQDSLNRFIIKFPKQRVITSQHTVDMRTDDLHRIDLEINTNIYFNNLSNKQMKIISI